MNTLPFSNYFFDTPETVPTNPYASMKTLIESYGLGFESFMHKLTAVDAVIGGSSVARVFMNKKLDYLPDDIDIFVRNTSELKPLVAYLRAYGYSIDMESSMTLLKTASESAVEPVVEATDALTTYRLLQKEISEVWTYRDGGKKIQIVLVNNAPIDFIKKCTDLSCTAISYITWSSFYPHMKPYSINEKALYHLRRKEMYIQDHYKPVLEGDCGEKRRAKLSERIAKYESRGFKLIDGPSEIRIKVDPRNYVVADKHKTYDIIAVEDITVAAALKEVNNIILYTAPGISYAIDRFALIKYCKERGMTYWNQRVCPSQIHRFSIQDYSVYTIHKTNGGKDHKVYGYPMKAFYSTHTYAK
jgi:hypothetical protein